MIKLSDTSNRSILLVEDDKEARSSMAMALRLNGYDVYEAGNGEEGVDKLREATPDLILADINMPVMNGLEFLKVVRRNNYWVSIPFVFLTANDSIEDIQLGHELGVEDYLTKPIDYDQLLRIINARLIRSLELQAAFLDQAFLETINVLAKTVESRDPYTFGHIDRVARYAKWFAEELGWSPAALRVVEFGARLHDIGKIVIPDAVLKKTGPLTQAEWRMMKKHPIEGARIIGEIKILRNTVPYILYHHEKWDGSGYPKGLTGKKIPVEGRMLAIVDVFDALTTDRPYRPAMSLDEVNQFIRKNSGTHFDPDLTPVFLRVVQKQIAGQP